MQMLEHAQGARYIRRICQGEEDRSGANRELQLTGMDRSDGNLRRSITFRQCQWLKADSVTENSKNMSHHEM